MDKNHFSQITDAKNVKSFGVLPDGKEVLCFTLQNKNGYELSIVNYGATITSLRIPTSDNKKIDAVLGFESLEDYINSFDLPSPPFLGTVVGRFAGRINKAEFILNGKHFFLNKNHNGHNIHGGSFGFSRKFWKAKMINLEENPSITFEYTSADGEENFPGELTVKVTYTLTESNELKVDFTAKATEDTIVNLTQHSYFNLDGHSEGVSGQMLMINSVQMLETNQDLIPTGKFIPLENHDYNFSSAKPCPLSIDNTFILENDKAAVLYSEKNKLKMTVITNQPAVHVYVGGNCFGQLQGIQNANYHPTSGICFETQNFPDAPNHSLFPNSILRKGETYNHNTIFKFENI